MSDRDGFLDVACDICEALSVYELSVAISARDHTTTLHATRLDTGCEHVARLPAYINCMRPLIKDHDAAPQEGH